MNTQRKQDRNNAIEWAKGLRDSQEWVILDTETTGLDSRAEIIQIGIIDRYGAPMMNNVLVKPVHRIPAEATAIHHITNEMVKACPPFSHYWPQLEKIITTNRVIIYNADYDGKLLRQTARLYGIGLPPFAVHCAMLMYAQFVGQWDDMRGSYRWQRLQGGGHNAIEDCRATLKVLETMWSAENEVT